MLVCLEPEQQAKFVRSSSVGKKRRRSTQMVEKPQAVLRGNIRPLTQTEKQVLENLVALKPNRILDRSEVASLIEDVDDRKWKRIKKHVCVAVRPKFRIAQSDNSQTASSGSRCIYPSIAIDSPSKIHIVNFTFSSRNSDKIHRCSGSCSYELLR